jgi:hypothetical protein
MDVVEAEPDRTEPNKLTLFFVVSTLLEEDMTIQFIYDCSLLHISVYVAV